MIPYLFLGRFRGLLELPFFAGQDTKTPVVSAMLSATLFVAISFFLVRIAGVYGIPLARSFGYGVGAWFLIHLLRRRIGKIGFGSVRDVSIRICAASLFMAVFIWVGNWLAASVPLHGIAAKATALALPTAFGSGALILSLFVLRVLDPALIKRGWEAMERRTAGWLALNRTPNSL
jgi:peptidoglycan biosynthesis protein MviN/MurJ (putative lipid II flippase)